MLERNRIKESFVCYAQFWNDSECQKTQRHNRVHIVGNAELFVRRLDEVNFSRATSFQFAAVMSLAISSFSDWTT